MTGPAHPRVAEVTRLLADAGSSGEVRVLPSEVRTAQAAAAALGVPAGAIVNSLVFAVDDGRAPRPLLVLTSGAHRVDETAVAGLLGVGGISRATPDFVREHTGQAIGGVAPVGHPAPIQTLVDIDLSRHERVWAAAGHPSAVFCTSYDELLRLTAGSAAEVAAGPAPAEAAGGRA